MVLSEIDRNLLERCLQGKPRAWEDFVDRFLGLVTHVVNHTAQARSVRLTPEDRDDLSAEVLLTLIRRDCAVLRSFRGQSSLATYLTVVARRIVVQHLMARNSAARLGNAGEPRAAEAVADPHAGPEQQLSQREQIEHLLGGLPETEAKAVRMYHIEGKTYQQIGSTLGMPENSVGPLLSRARDRLRRTGVNPAAG